VFGFFRRRRRARLRAKPFPTVWRNHLERNVSWYSVLEPAERTKLEGDLAIFLAEKNWEGCAGLVITDEIKVTIAGQASLLSLAWKDFHFDAVISILVYPAAYRAKGREEFGDALPTERVGEAFGRETVVLSWRDSRADARGARDGRNVVLHEFAHILDMEDGLPDGVPHLNSDSLRATWRTCIHREIERMQQSLLARRGTLLDPYAVESPPEFFAVATESFFELALDFQREMPEFYRLMSDYYGQDPARRWSAPSET
jgi:MtfA peptidase